MSSPTPRTECSIRWSLLGEEADVRIYEGGVLSDSWTWHAEEGGSPRDSIPSGATVNEYGRWS